MKKIITIISAIILVASISSCDKLEGTEKTKADIVDVEWKLDRVKLAEDDSGLQDFLDLMFGLVSTYYDFKADGTYEAYAKILGQKADPTEGTWELSEDGKVFTFDEVAFDLDVATSKNLEFSASMEEAAGLLGYNSEDYDENRLSYVFVKK